MARQSNAAPVIIKRKKIIAGGGHHGGAWKVAYADFVTAMMAFFLLMWLLNATTENQRKGLADYFSPAIPINRVSGGGDGALGGDSAFAEDQIAQDGRGGSGERDGAGGQSEGSGEAEGEGAADPEATVASAGRAQRDLEELHDRLLARGGESMASDRALRHIVSRLDDAGLVIELFDLPEASLFVDDTAEPTETLRAAAALLAEMVGLLRNAVAIEGHVHAFPVVIARNPAWDLSVARAQAMRALLEEAGIAAARIERVTGHADRRPVVNNPMALRNNRLEVIVLREGAGRR